MSNDHYARYSKWNTVRQFCEDCLHLHKWFRTVQQHEQPELLSLGKGLCSHETWTMSVCFHRKWGSWKMGHNWKKQSMAQKQILITSNILNVMNESAKNNTIKIHFFTKRLFFSIWPILVFYHAYENRTLDSGVCRDLINTKTGIFLSVLYVPTLSISRIFTLT